MVILGLNYYFHDSTACIVKDGKLICAIEEERLNRDKHTQAFPELAIKKCLAIAGLKHSDIDHIAVSIKPQTHWFKKVVYITKNLKSFMPFFGHHLVNAYAKQRRFKLWYKNNFKDKEPKIHFIEHHLTHVAGTFYVSPYKEAALLGIDGSGEWATTWLGYGTDNNVNKLGESFFPNSLGSFYETVTQFCGFIPNYDEGKTMGLAPMGDASVFKEEVEKIVKINAKGELKVDLSYFNYQHLIKNRFSEKFIKIFGEPRKGAKDDFKDNHINAAAAFQRVLEDKVLEMCNILHTKTKADYLVISGGVSLNSVMNGRIVRETPFKDVYVMPAAGDNGTAIGAAYYLYNGILKKPRNFVHDNPYLGTEYSNNEISKAIKDAKLEPKYFEDICEKAAELLSEGKIIGWFQGKMEIGPRALGSRSILANPAYPDMKDKINAEVKHREAYRPFAPSALVDSYKEYFDLEVEAPFMLKVCNVHKDKQQVIPAVTHVDGSARLQTVDGKHHPLYYKVIKKLSEKTGVPVVLNTSFNIQGEPVVESPKDALRCFYSTGLDALVIGNYVLEK